MNVKFIVFDKTELIFQFALKLIQFLLAWSITAHRIVLKKIREEKNYNFHSFIPHLFLSIKNIVNNFKINISQPLSEHTQLISEAIL